MRLRGESRIDSWQSEKVKDQGGLGEKSIPKVQRKNRVTAGDARNQVVLEGLCGALSRVFSVQVGGYKMKHESLAAHIILEAGWTFIVKHLGEQDLNTSC